MNLYRWDDFWIEKDDKLNNFFCSDGNLYNAKYEQYSIKEEEIITKDCKILNSVILDKDKNITIIYTDMRNDLILITLVEGEALNKVLLIKNFNSNNNLKIISFNNSLNLFYISEVNNISTLCFRVLSSRLTLSQPIIMDAIDNRGHSPYIINYTKGELYLAYCKKGLTNYIGYRRFDFQHNSWGEFKILDSYYSPMNDYNMVIIEDKIGYYYTATGKRKSNIFIGVGFEDNIRRYKITEESDDIRFCNLMFYPPEKFDLIYLVDETVKVREIELKGEMSTLEDVRLNGIELIRVGNFTSNKDILSNKILVVNSKDLDIYTDTSFVSRIALEKYKSSIGLSKIMKENAIVKNLNMNNLDLSKSESLIKELLIKNRQYEEMITKISDKFIKVESERKKLLDAVDKINEQLTKKNYTINSYERALTERQTLVAQYEKKISEISGDSNKEYSSKNDVELRGLKERLKITEKEKNNYLNELHSYKSRYEEMEKRLLENSERIERANMTIQSVTNNENEFLNEKVRLEGELSNLQQQIQDYNLLIVRIKEENTMLNNKISSLEEKNKQSFFNKIFKGE